MNILNIVRYFLGAVLITGGLVFDVIQLIGFFRYKYVMNRIHAAAIGDTLGGGLILLGVFLINGFNLAGLKILFIMAFLWLTSPVAAHMVGKLEVLSKEHPEDCCPVKNLPGAGSLAESIPKDFLQVKEMPGAGKPAEISPEADVRIRKEKQTEEEQA